MKSERRDETSARRVVRTSGVLAVSRMLELGAGLVVAVLVASELGVAALGVYSIGWAVFSLLSIAGQAGLREYVTRELSRAPEQTSAYVVHLSLMAAAGAILLVGGAVAVIQVLPYSRETELSASVAALVVVPKVLNVIQEATFLAHGRPELELVPRAVGFAAYVGLTAVLLEAGNGVPAVFGAVLGVECGVSLVYFVLIGRYVARLRARLDLRLARRLAGEVRPYAASAALAALFSRPEIIILSIVASESSVGLYGAAVRISDMSLLLVDIFLASVFPLLAKEYGRDEHRFTSIQAIMTRVVLAITLPLVAVLIAAGGDILALFFGEGFRDATELLQILSLNVLVFAMFAVAWRVLVARGRQDLNVKIQSLTVPVRLVGGLAFAVPLGALGAAIAAVVGGVVHYLLLVIAARRIGAPIRIERRAWRLVPAAAATGLAAWGLTGILPTVAALAASGFVYGAIVVATGSVARSDRALVREAIQGT